MFFAAKQQSHWIRSPLLNSACLINKFVLRGPQISGLIYYGLKGVEQAYMNCSASSHSCDDVLQVWILACSCPGWRRKYGDVGNLCGRWKDSLERKVIPIQVARTPISADRTANIASRRDRQLTVGLEVHFIVDPQHLRTRNKCVLISVRLDSLKVMPRS